MKAHTKTLITIEYNRLTKLINWAMERKEFNIELFNNLTTRKQRIEQRIN